MASCTQLREHLERIDGRGYPAYKDIRGHWDFSGFLLMVDHVQGDPFASPSRVRVGLRLSFPADVDVECRIQRQATEDWLLRRFAKAITSHRRGSGRSGEISCLRPGPEVEERSAVRVHADGYTEFRFRIGLPARGRRILGREAWSMFDDDIRYAVGGFSDFDGLPEHVSNVQRQEDLRSQLKERGLVAFIEEGAILPRASGIDDSPMRDAVPFASPPSMRVTLTHNDEPVIGMGIREGVSVIVGGGFHGKSTLLNAIQSGHLDHVRGDGREGVVTVSDAVKVKAEDGRSVASVDISPFLSNLPAGKCTKTFGTADASGSTSQAAAIIESLEAGASLLLMDEDTSATNLLVRDERMRQLIGRKDEPITPFVERVRQLYEQASVSTILVIGGVADYLGVADHVIAMIAFRAHDYTEKAADLSVRNASAPNDWCVSGSRTVLTRSLEADKISARDNRALRFGRSEIALQAVEQICSADHAFSVGHAIRTMAKRSKSEATMADMLDLLETVMDTETVDALSPRKDPSGDLIRPRRHEVAAALNRLRVLNVRVPDKS